jgi:hypothetical protein
MHAATVFLEIEALTDGGSSSKIRYADAALLVSRTSRTMVHARSVGLTARDHAPLEGLPSASIPFSHA